MRVSYEELIGQIGALQPDLDAANLAERAVGRTLGPSSKRIVGQVATHARGGGFGRASAVDLACEIASIEALDPDLRRAILIDVADDGEVGTNYASPSICGDIEAMAMVACTPSAFVGMCMSSSATVCLLRAVSDRAGAKCPWSPEWFRREAFRLASLGGRCDDGDIARNALSARFDTVWSGLAAECLYGMFRERKIGIGTDLWVRAAEDAKLDGWMYKSWLETAKSLSWFEADFLVDMRYAGVNRFAEELQANGEWSASIFDGEDFLEIESDPSILSDWFGCFSIAALGDITYDNMGGAVWDIPFMSARSGIGVLTIRASLSEHPDAVVRGLRLPGIEWIQPTKRRTWVADGETLIEMDGGEEVPIMELSDSQAIESGIFYSYDESCERQRFWNMPEAKSDEN